MLKNLICFSHLRWNFVYQRPQHLLSRFAKESRLFYVEEPMFDAKSDHYHINKVENQNIWVVVFHLQADHPNNNVDERQKILLDYLIEDMEMDEYALWYYSPEAYSFSSHLKPNLIIYDCMDELSAFKFAPPSLTVKETHLLENADVVFTGGHSLYEAKKDRHSNVYAFPSSIDKDHFGAARTIKELPEDVKNIPHPQFGFYGVVDERFDIDLLGKMAVKRPDWHFVIIGPVVKIDPATLPDNKNIHYLGGKSYQDLPKYLASWDVAIMPFALNESTKYISPTKTPEYLAGGKPVVSTSIRDVVDPYQKKDLVYIADTVDDFITAGENALVTGSDKQWLQRVDTFLKDISWDITWNRMMQIIRETISKNHLNQKEKLNEYV